MNPQTFDHGSRKEMSRRAVEKEVYERSKMESVLTAAVALTKLGGTKEEQGGDSRNDPPGNIGNAPTASSVFFVSQPTFPEILMEILSDESNQDCISWLPHGRSFRVLNRDRFLSEVLPRYYRNQVIKYTSFTRKLSRWEFVRLVSGADIGSFYHKLFQRDNPQLCRKMTCRGELPKFVRTSAPRSGGSAPKIAQAQTQLPLPSSMATRSVILREHREHFILNRALKLKLDLAIARKRQEGGQRQQHHPAPRGRESPACPPQSHRGAVAANRHSNLLFASPANTFPAQTAAGALDALPSFRSASLPVAVASLGAAAPRRAGCCVSPARGDMRAVVDAAVRVLRRSGAIERQGRLIRMGGGAAAMNASMTNERHLLPAADDKPNQQQIDALRQRAVMAFRRQCPATSTLAESIMRAYAA